MKITKEIISDFSIKYTRILCHIEYELLNRYKNRYIRMKSVGQNSRMDRNCDSQILRESLTYLLMPISLMYVISKLMLF